MSVVTDSLRKHHTAAAQLPLLHILDGLGIRRDGEEGWQEPRWEESDLRSADHHPGLYDAPPWHGWLV